MERSRECCSDCPYHFDHGETESWGCILFGEECKKNKQLDDETCYVHPRRLQYLAYRYNKRSESLEKECTKYCTEYKDFLCSLSKFYRPNMKGGHTHNHIKNMELRLMLSKKEIKALRKIMKREKKNGRN